MLVVGGLLQQVDGGVPYRRPGSHNGSSKLVDEVYCRFSPPEQLHSDQGRQLESELILSRLLRKTKTRKTPNQLQRDGLVE